MTGRYGGFAATRSPRRLMRRRRRPSRARRETFQRRRARGTRARTTIRGQWWREACSIQGSGKTLDDVEKEPVTAVLAVRQMFTVVFYLTAEVEDRVAESGRKRLGSFCIWRLDEQWPLSVMLGHRRVVELNRQGVLALLAIAMRRKHRSRPI